MQLDQSLLKQLTDRKVPLERLEALEKECVFDKFDADVAFEMGSFIRNEAKEMSPNKAIAIDISLPNGHCLFRSVTPGGSSLDNDFWIKRKQTTVLRFGHSTMFMGIKKGKLTPEEKFFVDSKEYAFHGGSIPLFIAGSAFPFAVLTVSGLKQEEDHLFATTATIKFVSKRAAQKTQLDLD
ncbi:hypothetical protein TBLA_0F01050 [Henningerozyma blattae CBS 6284]|uniref:Uncharacterized protein n=1 Tax=Henningerozyma blattae (strain ATCC 34711 / CBS 6284 / DSM 70876 / NBRC 10599 / NRRL Y-10934 / UCD 77-7) TaxID=1071380 RepID=I2H5J6_HENB6|nr:hypothetical protein TBLA_0F01050 [Tetrapisispora blattae CBS 6284]CCH61648.1 hypothetical protein TBLA_0F01050 [Tetrapisispora blattae CBS 6284]